MRIPSSWISDTARNLPEGHDDVRLVARLVDVAAAVLAPVRSTEDGAVAFAAHVRSAVAFAAHVRGAFKQHSAAPPAPCTQKVAPAAPALVDMARVAAGGTGLLLGDELAQ